MRGGEIRGAVRGGRRSKYGEESNTRAECRPGRAHYTHGAACTQALWRRFSKKSRWECRRDDEWLECTLWSMAHRVLAACLARPDACDGSCVRLPAPRAQGEGRRSSGRVRVAAG